MNSEIAQAAHTKVVLLDTTIVWLLCHKSQTAKASAVHAVVKELSGQEIRTDSVYVSAFLMIECLGITIKDLIKIRPELFLPIANSEEPVSVIFKRELDKTIKILSELDRFQASAIKNSYSEYLKHQSPVGQYWINSFLGFHVGQFSEEHRSELVRRVATEIVIARPFDGFDDKALSLQFATMYVTGIVHGDEALATPRALDKILEPMANMKSNEFFADTNMTAKEFHEAQSFRDREELLDVEMIHQTIFGHRSHRYGRRSVIAFTCENPKSIRARIDAATGFLVCTKDVHREDFLPGEIYCLDRKTISVVEHFKIDEFIQKQIGNDIIS